MADIVKLQLNSTSSNGDLITTSINYANPNADNATLKLFAQKLNALTRNSYSATNKITTENIDKSST